MMRYVILMALLLCLPVRGESWQVVGGGSVGVTLGPEKLNDPSFESSVMNAPWSRSETTPTIEDGDLVFTAGSYKNAFQQAIKMAAPLVVGETYRVTVDKEPNTGIALRVGSFSGTTCSLPLAGGVQSCDFTASSTAFEIKTSSGPVTATLHSISVKKIP